MKAKNLYCLGTNGFLTDCKKCQRTISEVPEAIKPKIIWKDQRPHRIEIICQDFIEVVK